MTIDAWLGYAAKKLTLASVSTAQLDALLLCGEVLHKPKTWLLAHGDTTLTKRHIELLEELLIRRNAHEPIAYILGRAEFYGREFEVSSDTLQPRPETETLIEMCLAHFKIEDRRSKSEGCVIADVGTGSGCIAVTLALELRRSEIGDRRSKILATDISEKALAVAKRNAKKLAVDIEFRRGNLLDPILPDLRSTVSDLVIVANLPYVPRTHQINKAARHEPDIAIFGGDDGLQYYRELFAQLSTIPDLRSPILITESLPPQHVDLRNIAESHGFAQTDEVDFIQVFKTP